MERDCWPECLVFITLSGEDSEGEEEIERGCLAITASAEEVRKYGVSKGEGETDRERTI
jgi:hypothetical protein